MLLLTLLAACGGDDTGATPVPRFTAGPSATPTPRSTALPTVASPVPVGVEQRPIKIAFVGEMTTAKRTLAGDLSEALTDELKNFRFGYYQGITVEFTNVATPQEALNLLCNSPDTVVLVDAFTYIAAEKMCGAQPAFQIRRGTGRNVSSGESFEIVVNNRVVTNLTNMKGRDRRFCTESLESKIGFIYPAMALRQYNFDLLDAQTIQIVTEGVENDVEVVQGLTGGANQRICEAVSLPAGRFEEIVDELDIELADVGLLTSNELQGWPTIPYDVLVFPPDNLMPEFLREEIINAISAVLEDEDEASEDLENLFGFDSFVRVAPEDFAEFRTWLQNTGWNMAESVGS